MAVQFKKKDQFDVIKKIGGKALAKVLKDKGVHLATTMKGFILEFEGESVVITKMAPLAQLKVGVAKSVADKQLAAFKQAYDHLMVAANPPFGKGQNIQSIPKSAVSDGVPIGEVSDLKFSTPGGKSIHMGKGDLFVSKVHKDKATVIGVDLAGTEQKVMNQMLNPVQNMKGKKVHLKDATEVYQPVLSTSEGSTYYTVAIRDDLKIAARLKHNRVSVRAEGKVAKYKAELVGAGFSMNNGYASFHVEADNSALRGKVVGSALFGLGIQFGKLVADIKALDHKGA